MPDQHTEEELRLVTSVDERLIEHIENTRASLAARVSRECTELPPTRACRQVDDVSDPACAQIEKLVRRFVAPLRNVALPIVARDQRRLVLHAIGRMGGPAAVKELEELAADDHLLNL